MPRQTGNPQIYLGPGVLQQPGIFHGTDDIIPAMHDYTRDIGFSDGRDVVVDIIIVREKHVVVKIMGLQTPQGKNLLVSLGFTAFLVRNKISDLAFILCQGPSCLQENIIVTCCHARVISGNEVVPFLWGDVVVECFPVVWIDETGTILVQPVVLPQSSSKDPTQNQPKNPTRVHFSVD
eukprot:Lithocolla_globosa_v1_NODE_5849_length_1176_cov_8.512043.p2 type:complete len:179 gc:universal NODE_5849_length_1176_cov_8.512043:977-441(-)